MNNQEVISWQEVLFGGTQEERNLAEKLYQDAVKRIEEK
jgi:hypothetical protein